MAIRRLRSNDYPNIDEYPISLLREVASFYEDLMRMDPVPKNTLQMIQNKFNLPVGKASVVMASAKFAYEMKRKGKA